MGNVFLLLVVCCLFTSVFLYLCVCDDCSVGDNDDDGDIQIIVMIKRRMKKEIQTDKMKEVESSSEHIQAHTNRRERLLGSVSSCLLPRVNCLSSPITLKAHHARSQHPL